MSKRKPQRGVCGHCGRACPDGRHTWWMGVLVRVRCHVCEPPPVDWSPPSEKPGNP